MSPSHFSLKSLVLWFSWMLPCMWRIPMWQLNVWGFFDVSHSRSSLGQMCWQETCVDRNVYWLPKTVAAWYSKARFETNDDDEEPAPSPLCFHDFNSIKVTSLGFWNHDHMFTIKHYQDPALRVTLHHLRPLIGPIMPPDDVTVNYFCVCFQL